MYLRKTVDVFRSQYDVLVVDDNSEIRKHICAAIHDDPALAVWGEAGSVSETCHLLEYGLPALALIELELPDGRGESIISGLYRQAPYVRTIVLSMFGGDQNVSNAIESGASGYLLKSEPAINITPGIKQALKGRSPIFPACKQSKKTVKGQAQSSSPPSVTHSKIATAGRPILTPAETEILNYIAKGFTGPEIADITGRSVNTVPVHMKNIYRKLSVSGRGEAVFRALQLGLIGGSYENVELRP